MEKEIELKFIETTLQQYGARLQSALVKAISEKGLVSKEGTNHLKDNISYDVKRTVHLDISYSYISRIMADLLRSDTT